MTNLLHTAAQWLSDTLAASVSEAMTYTREGLGIPIAATVGSSQFEAETSLGVIETFRSQDVLVPAASLVLAGALITPQAGDRITDGQGQVFEVTAPGGMTPWRYADPHRIAIRIHTKRIEA